LRPAHGPFQLQLGHPGQPVPYLLVFRTAEPGGGASQPSPVQQARSEQAFQQVLEIMTTFYSYKDRLNIDWAGTLTTRRDWLLQSPNDFIFAARLVALLRPAQDPL